MTKRRAGLRRWVAISVAAFLVALPPMAMAQVSTTEGPEPVSDVPQPTGDQPGWMVNADPGPDGEPRAYFVYNLDPGDRVEDTMFVTNHTETSLRLAVFGSDAFNDPETGQFALLPTEESPTDIGAWVTVEQDEIVVPPRGRVEVPFVLEIPHNATPGDHAGGIVTSFGAPTTDEDGQEIVFEARLAMRIYLGLSGDLNPDLVIEEAFSSFEMSANQITGTLTVTHVVRNEGNIRLGTEETVSLSGPFGVAIGEPITGTVPELLPGSHERRTYVFENVPAMFSIRSELVSEPFDFTGRVAEGDLQPISAETSVIAIPWVWIIGLVLLASGIVFVIRRRRKRWQALKAELDEMRQSTTSQED